MNCQVVRGSLTILGVLALFGALLIGPFVASPGPKVYAAMAAPGSQLPDAAPAPGEWTGTTDQGYEVSFTVAPSASYVSRFKIKYRVPCTYAIATTTVEVGGRYDITDGRFTVQLSGRSYRFTGTFDSETSAHGDWSDSWYSTSAGRCSGSGTWTATSASAAAPTPTPTATPTPAATPTPTATATPTPTGTPTPTATATPTPALTPTAAPTPTVAPTATGTPRPTPTANQIQLAAGWNLISVPSAQQDPSISTVFAQAPAVTKVNAFQDGNWANALRGAEGWMGSLTQIVDGKGYWVYATEATALTLHPKSPDPLALPPSYSLPAGWSMIGYTSSIATLPVETYLATLAGKWTSLYRYDATKGWETAKPGGFGFKEMELGKGYWIYLTSAGTLVP